MQNLNKYVVLDLETTGLEPAAGAEIMEFGAVIMENGEVVKEYETLLKPQNMPPVEITVLTGISSEDLENQPNLEAKRAEIAEFIGDLPIVGHNINFDVGFLRYYGFELGENEILDTCSLAECLVRGVDSFSLESLSQEFAFPAEDAHRALGDVRQTARLMEVLKRIARNIPADEKNKIIEIAEKCEWSMGQIFVGEGEKYEYDFTKKVEKNSLNISVPELSDRVLLSVPPHSEAESIAKLSEKYEDEMLVICPSIESVDNLKNRLENSAELFAPSGYLDGEKFLEFQNSLEKENEVRLYFWLKIFLWESRSETGTVSELSFRGQDYALWEEVCADSEENNYFQIAQKKCENSKIILSNFRSLVDCPKVFADYKNVVVLKTENLDWQILSNTEKKIFSERLMRFVQSNPDLEDLEIAVDLFFGIAGRMVDVKSPMPYPEHQVMDFKTKGSRYYSELKGAGQNLIEKFRSKNVPFLDKISRELEQFFLEGSNIVSHITVYPSGEVSLHSADIEIEKLLSEILALDSRENKVFVSEHFFRSVMDFLREEYGMNQYDIVRAENMDGAVHSDLQLPDVYPPEDSWGSEKNMQNYIKEKIQENLRPTVVIFSSKKALNQYFEFMFEEFFDAGITLLGEGRTGGIGKNLTKFRGLENPVLFISERTFRRVKLENKENLNVILTKLPFEWMSPVNSARAKKYENDFMDFSLPRALLKFDEIVLKATSLIGVSGSFVCLDRRVKEKKYGEEFARILEGRGNN